MCLTPRSSWSFKDLGKATPCHSGSEADIFCSSVPWAFAPGLYIGGLLCLECSSFFPFLAGQLLKDSPSIPPPPGSLLDVHPTHINTHTHTHTHTHTPVWVNWLAPKWANMGSQCHDT